SMADERKRESPLLAVVVPCYNEEAVIEDTLIGLIGIIEDLKSSSTIDEGSFIYCVDDGSRDRTWDCISEAHSRDATVKGLKLTANVGHQNALLAGLLSVRENVDCIITIDADLQDDITIISDMLEKFLEGYDIVYGVRKKRAADSIFKQYSATFFYKMMHMLGVKIVYNHADFRLISRRVVDSLSTFSEVNLFLRGIIPLIGFQSTSVSYERKKRKAGKTKYPLRKMLSFAWDGITSFSVAPLRLVTAIGAIIFLGTLALSAWALYSKMVGRVLPGWTSTVLPIYFIGGIQVMCIGVIGEYLGKIYMEVKARPRYIKDMELF
ncbi:glycosyltransferase family 2 protein, partial [Candidatus Latescibacterota bacterium]